MDPLNEKTVVANFSDEIWVVYYNKITTAMKIPEENYLKLLFVHIIVLEVIKIVFFNDHLVMEP